MFEEPSLFTLFYPDLSLLGTWRIVDADTFTQYGLLWLTLLVHCGTTIYATVTAYRYKFREYSLDVVKGIPSAFFGCLFFWPYAFFNCLHNRQLIENGEAPPRSAGHPRRGIIAAAVTWNIVSIFLFLVAVPAMTVSPVRVNENATISMMKKDRDAQLRFRSENLGSGEAGANLESGFCPSFRALYYGKDETGEPRALIPQEMADAFTKTVSDVPGADALPGKPVAYKEHYYCDDPYVTANGLWQSQFGLYAYPKRPNLTGTNVFWIGEDGHIRWRDYNDMFGRDHNGKHTGQFTAEHSPLHPEGGKLWEEF